MIARLIAWFRRRPAYDAASDPYVEKMRRRREEALRQQQASVHAVRASDQRRLVYESRDFAVTLDVPPVWDREGGAP